MDKLILFTKAVACLTLIVFLCYLIIVLVSTLITTLQEAHLRRKVTKLAYKGAEKLIEKETRK